MSAPFMFPEYSKSFLLACKRMAFDQVFPGVVSDRSVDLETKLQEVVMAPDVSIDRSATSDYETKLQELAKKYGVDAGETSAIVDTFIDDWKKKKRKFKRGGRGR